MTSTSTTAAPAARRSLAELREEIRLKQGEAAAMERRRLEIDEELREARRDSSSASLKDVTALEEQRLEASRTRSSLGEAVNRLEHELAVRTRMPERLDRLASVAPSQLEDWLELKRDELAEAGAKLKAHDTGRDRLLRSPSVEAVARHDDARRELSLAAERARAIVEDLEHAHAAAVAAWPEHEAAFDAALLLAKKEQAEGLRLLHEYLEKAAPRVAAIVARLEEIDQNLDAVRERGRYLSRGGEVPPSPNHILREGERPLYRVGALNPEVQLPGADHRTIWPRPRAMQPRARKEARNTEGEATNAGAEP